ncbi:MAG: hypothetical protein ACT4PT_01640 [Methanobacteriota archaeon]
MKPAVVLSGVMLVAATAIAGFVLIPEDPQRIGATMAPAASAAEHDASHDAHDALHAGGGAGLDADGFPIRARVAWTPEDGRIPTEADARALEEVRRLVIESDAEFSDVDFVTGSGTAEDPYVFDGLYVRGDLYIADTSEYFVVRNSYIAGQLSLNWVGDRAYVHHNYIRDLRVNENVERTGDPTAGLIEANAIGFVGQLRHFDGVFRDNTVGPKPPGFFEEIIGDSGVAITLFQDDVVFNFDGFNGADVYRNAIIGAVDIGLHGHHHSNGFTAVTHNHGEAHGAGAMDHGDRWHSLKFHENEISITSGLTALRFEDENHAGDDRTARSESDEALEAPHVHHTKVLILRNTLRGGNLLVDVFIEDEDRYHKEASPSALVVKDNTITLTGPKDSTPNAEQALFRWQAYRAQDGVRIESATDFLVTLEGNTIRNEAGKEQNDPLAAVPFAAEWFGAGPPAGLSFSDFAAGSMDVHRNAVAHFPVGIRARYFDESVDWTLSDNAYEDVDREVDTDDSVESEPDQE